MRRRLQVEDVLAELFSSTPLKHKLLVEFCKAKAVILKKLEQGLLALLFKLELDLAAVAESRGFRDGSNEAGEAIAMLRIVEECLGMLMT